MRSYFSHTSDPQTVFVNTGDANERARLKRRGWFRIGRSDAIKRLGGEKMFLAALDRCQFGEIENTGNRYVCHGRSASRTQRVA